MSWEEDYLMKKSRETDKRLRTLEESAGLTWYDETESYDAPEEPEKEEEEKQDQEQDEEKQDDSSGEKETAKKSVRVKRSS